MKNRSKKPGRPKKPTGPKRKTGRPRLEYECGCGRPPTHKRNGALCCDHCAEIEERFNRSNQARRSNSLRLSTLETDYIEGFSWADKRQFDIGIAEFWKTQGVLEPKESFNPKFNPN